MKKRFLFLSLLIVITLACDLAVTVASPTSLAPLSTTTSVPVLDVPTLVPASITPLPATSVPDATPLPSFEGAALSYGPIHLTLPPGVASGFSGSQFPRADGENVVPWELTPGHTQIKLEGYLLQGKFHEPQIYVYPALGYAEMFPAAFESMHRLRNTLYDPATAIETDLLPGVPFFNAGQVFASNVEVISFQNGEGVRFLTQYAQYFAPANNHELFYHFQGFSSDGEYYVVVILPVTAPVLPESSDTGAVLPPGGIPFPDIADPNADWTGYYQAVTALLSSTPPEAFSPTLDQLDALVQSIRITP